MGIAPNLDPLVDQLRGVVVPDDLAGEGAVDVLRQLVAVRAVVDHLLAVLTGVVDRLGVAGSQGRTLRELLIGLGCAPSVAQRLVRVGSALPLLPTLAAHAADGAISGEHVDAVVKGINHIQARAPGPVGGEARLAQVTDLLASVFRGRHRRRSGRGPAAWGTGTPRPRVGCRPGRIGR